MGKKDENSVLDDYEKLKNEIIRDKVNDIFRNHPKDYIAKMEELGFETDDKKFAKQTARQWGESKLDTPFTRVELHQGVMDSPDLDSDIFNGVRVRELPF